MSLLNNKKYYASFYDKEGKFIKSVKFKRKEKIVNYENGAYNIDIQKGSRTEVKGLIWDKYHYHYILGEPNPLKLDKKIEPLMDSELYKVNLDIKLAKELGDLAFDWKKYLTPTNIIIGVIIIAVAIYVLTGHKIIG